jgi:hypothetical protein
MYFSYDRQRKKLLLCQFHAGGFINEYVQRETTDDGKRIAFETERSENIHGGGRERPTRSSGLMNSSKRLSSLNRRGASPSIPKASGSG